MLLRTGSQLSVNSVKETGSAYFQNFNGYPGELEFRLSDEGYVGPWMRWLHVDFETLTSNALECGWSTEKLVETDKCGFLARLNPSL